MGRHCLFESKCKCIHLSTQGYILLGQKVIFCFESGQLDLILCCIFDCTLQFYFSLSDGLDRCLYPADEILEGKGYFFTLGEVEFISDTVNMFEDSAKAHIFFLDGLKDRPLTLFFHLPVDHFRAHLVCNDTVPASRRPTRHQFPGLLYFLQCFFLLFTKMFQKYLVFLHLPTILHSFLFLQLG